MSALERELARQLSLMGVKYRTEVRFAAEHVGLGKGVRERLKQANLKDWRFDFAIGKLAIECEGGIYINGRHNTGTGFEGDLDKYHAAMRMGWTVYRCGSKLINNGQASQLISELITKNRKQSISP